MKFVTPPHLRMENSIIQPPEAVVSKIMFILNNLSVSNIGEKADELKNLVTPDYVVWLVHHIILKRVTTESAFHSMYLYLIDYLNHPNLDQIVRQHILVTADIFMNKPATSYNVSALRNIGHFLGSATLGRGLPLPMNVRSVISKSLSGAIPVENIIPFTCKVIESARHPLSQPVKDILKDLKAVHSSSNLQGVQFEIELLFLKLELNLDLF